jgi:hypothetical protein
MKPNIQPVDGGCKVYNCQNVVQVNWTDGGFGLLLVEELEAALRDGKVFDRPPGEIKSIEFFPSRHLLKPTKNCQSAD